MFSLWYDHEDQFKLIEDLEATVQHNRPRQLVKSPSVSGLFGSLKIVASQVFKRFE